MYHIGVRIDLPLELAAYIDQWCVRSSFITLGQIHLHDQLHFQSGILFYSQLKLQEECEKAHTGMLK